MTGVEETGTIVGDVPPAPTPEAREMVDKAAEVVELLHEQQPRAALLDATRTAIAS